MKENIFSNFYSKVLNFFTSNKQDENSARDNATNRLKLVLLQDRSNLDGATMQKMREQIISVISKYIEIDTEALDLNLEGDGEEIALMLNIPVIRARTKEEIEEIEAQELKEIEEAKKAAIEEALAKENNVSSDDTDDNETEQQDSQEENSENSEENSSKEKDEQPETEETSNTEDEQSSDIEPTEENNNSQKSEKNKKKNKD